MMRWIVGSSLKFRLLVLATGVAALAVSVAHVRSMPRDVLPEFVPPTVEIQTEALGLSAEEVKELITVPMEQDLLNGVAFLKDMRSESVPGLSRILLIFQPGTDLYRARQVVAERMTQAVALPHVSKPPQMLQPLSSTNRVEMIPLSSKTVSPIEMSTLARWTIIPRLLSVPGVANVSVWGRRDLQLQVQVDPHKLASKDVSLLQVLETTGNALWVSPLTFVEASTPGSGGFIDTPNQRLTIQHINPITTAKDLSDVRVEDTKNLTLGDVATVKEDHQPLIGDAVVNDGRGLMLVVEKFPDANTPAVTRGVEDAIDALRPGLSGIDFGAPVYRPASFIDEATHNITVALVIGAALVALLLGAMLMRWRAVLVWAIVIPVSLLVAALVLDVAGVTMNALVLVGLLAALGLVIDDAVVTVDHVTRRLRDARRHGSETPDADVVREAALEVRRPAFYAALVIAIATVPFLFLNGVAGAFFPDLIWGFLVAVLASLVVTMALTPTLCLLLLGRISSEPRELGVVAWLRGDYQRGLARIVHRPWWAYSVVGVLAVGGAVSAIFVSHSLLPNIKESQLLIPWNAPVGTSLPEMNRITARATGELRALPGVTSVGAHVGRAVTADRVVNVNSAEIWVSVDQSHYGSTVRSIRRVIDHYPGFARDIESFSNERVREVLTGSDSDVVVRVYGDDSKVLQHAARRVRDAVGNVQGVYRARIAEPVDQPTMQIKVNLPAAERAGIRPGDIRREASTLLSGLQVGSLFEAQKVFDVIVRGTPSTRSSLTSVRRLLIDTPGGGHVRLGDVATVRIAAEPANIRRQASSNYLDVDVAVGGRDRGAVVSDIKRGLKGLALPLEYHAEVLASQKQPVGRLVAIAVAAAVGILLFLQVLFGSWRVAALAAFTPAVALGGGLVAIRAGGGAISFGSYAALFAVFGIAASNCIVFFDRIRKREKAGEELGPDLVVDVAGERFVPVVTTALASSLALIPFVVLGGMPGLELVRPLAIAALGGLVAATLTTLVVAPSLYLRHCRAYEPAEDDEAEVAHRPEAVVLPDLAG